MAHGRPGAAGYTGSRAIISPRLAGGAGRGAVRGRVWFRAHHPTEPERPLEPGAGADPGTDPGDDPPWAVWRLLQMKGMTPG